MATPYKLVRNSRVFFTKNVDSLGIISSGAASITAANTYEIQVLDGFSFSQATQQTTVQVSEAGTDPSRGQRAFNTSLDPVDISFSTYVRPYNNAGTITAEESVLWNALLSAKDIDATANAATAGTVAAFSRATTLTNVVTFTCAATDFSAKNIVSGQVVSVSGVTGNYANQWNAPAVLTITAGTPTAATGVTLTYLVTPSAAAGTTPASAPSSVIFSGFAWTTHGATGSGGGAVNAHAQVHSGGSNKNQLQKFGLLIVVDDIVYGVDNCVMDQASIDFGLDGIATIAWTAKGIALRQLSCAIAAGTNTWTGTPSGTSTAKNTAAQYITNKLSTMQLISKIGGTDGVAGTTYNVAITGGNLTIANNVNYVTPANLGVVNQAIGYFVGSRAISGNVTCYLKTGSGYSNQLLTDMLAANASETKFKIQLEIGGASNTVHVDVSLPGAVLQIPSIQTADVMSVTINYTAQGFDPILANQTYDLSQTNDLNIKYYA